MKILLLLLIGTLLYSQKNPLEIRLLNDTIYFPKNCDEMWEEKGCNQAMFLTFEITNNSDKTVLLHFNESELDLVYCFRFLFLPIRGAAVIIQKQNSVQYISGGPYFHHSIDSDTYDRLLKQVEVLDNMKFGKVDFKRNKLYKMQNLIAANSKRIFNYQISLPYFQHHENIPMVGAYDAVALDDDSIYDLSISLYSRDEEINNLYRKSELRKIKKAGIEIFYGEVRSNKIPLVGSDVHRPEWLYNRPEKVYVPNNERFAIPKAENAILDCMGEIIKRDLCT